MKTILFSITLLFALVMISCSSSADKFDLVEQDTLDVTVSVDSTIVVIEEDITVFVMEIDSIPLN